MKQWVSPYRICITHARTAHHLHRLKLKDSRECDGGFPDQTLLHVVQDCPLRCCPGGLEAINAITENNQMSCPRLLTYNVQINYLAHKNKNNETFYIPLDLEILLILLNDESWVCWLFFGFEEYPFIEDKHNTENCKTFFMHIHIEICAQFKFHSNLPISIIENASFKCFGFPRRFREENLKWHSISNFLLKCIVLQSFVIRPYGRQFCAAYWW